MKLLFAMNSVCVGFLALFLWRVGVAKDSTILNFILLIALVLSFFVDGLSFFGANYKIESKIRNLIFNKKNRFPYDQKDFYLILVFLIAFFITLDQQYFALKLDSIFKVFDLGVWVYDWGFHCIVLFSLSLCIKISGIALNNRKLQHSTWLFLMFYSGLFCLRGLQ